MLFRSPIFTDLNETDLTKIGEKMISRVYEKGQMILLEESSGETFFILTKGAVKVTRLSDDGREVILAILSESDFFWRNVPFRWGRSISQYCIQ